MSITERSVNSMIQSQGSGDRYRNFIISQRDGLDYNLAYIPATFNALKEEAFDPVYMGKLFDVGYEMAAKGYPWQKLPPGYDPSDDAAARKTSASP